MVGLTRGEKDLSWLNIFCRLDGEHTIHSVGLTKVKEDSPLRLIFIRLSASILNLAGDFSWSFCNKKNKRNIYRSLKL